MLKGKDLLVYYMKQEEEDCFSNSAWIWMEISVKYKFYSQLLSTFILFYHDEFQMEKDPTEDISL